MAKYISTNMENGPQVKEALERVFSHHPEVYSWIEISDDILVDLKSPTASLMVDDPGDYVIYNFTNGPDDISTTLSPVLLTIRNGKYYVSANGTIYTLDSNKNWIDASTIIDENTIVFIKSDSAPSQTTNTLWFDTSTFDGSEDQYIDLKYYDTSDNQWKSIFDNSDGSAYIKKSEFDPTNKGLDVYQYITDRIMSIFTDYAEFVKHKNNQLTLIHVTADERATYAKIITEDELRDLLNNTYKPAIETAISNKISELGTGEAGAAIAALENNVNSHIDNHVSTDDISNWNNKADLNHTHDYTNDDTMKIPGENIVSGILDDARLPNEIKERYYKISSTPEDEFSNTSITDDDRSSKYHNGNAFYYESTNETTGEIIRTWYRIIDSTKIGTSEWADGISNFTAKETDLSWENITGHPTNLDEFGITNTLYTKTEIDTNISEYNKYVNEATPIIEKYEEPSSYTYNTKFTWTESTISDTSRYWYSVCYGNGKFIALNYNSNYFAYSTDGITWTEGTIGDTKRDWYSVCYGNGKFIAVAEDDSIFAYSTDGINWTEGTISSTSRYWTSVCYGNDKFVAVSRSKYFAYSTDGITWTEGTMPSNRGWHSVCYGNDKYVTVGSGYSAYSTDGINWTETNNGLTGSYWYSVCYGNDKFVAVAGNNSNHFAYSTDGIHWTEGTISDTSRYWNSACYGNGKYVAVAEDGYFAYSTDGITWTEGTISDTSRNWRSVCYGNGKFVAVTSNYFAYSIDFIAYLSAKKIGLQYKNSDITNYTDTMTGTNPQLDCIILTTDNKIYKTTFNNNSTYLKFDGSYYTTTNSAEPLGATMLEIKLPNDETAENYFNSRFASDYATMKENPNYSTSGCGICVTVNNTIQTINIDDPKCTIEYSTDGINFTYTKGNMINNVINVGLGSTDKLNTIGDTYNTLKKDVVHEYGGSYTGDIDDIAKVWTSVCYGNGKYVGVANGTTSAYSTNGNQWTESTISSTSREWSSVCYGNGKYVSVAYNSNVFAYSTNGINWTEGTLPSTHNWNSVCYGNNYFIAVNDDSDYYAYSIDGINWSEDLPVLPGCNCVTYGNGKCIAVGSGTKCVYTLSYTSWNEVTISDTSRDWKTVCYGNDKFVAIANNSNYYAYSTDGITWTEGVISNCSRKWNSVCYGNGVFVAVSDSSNYFAYSYDGLTWYEVEMEKELNLKSICYSPDLERFVAVGPEGFVVICVPNDWGIGTKSTFTVTYVWTGITSDNPSVIPSTTTYLPNTNVTVDTNYTDSTVFETDNNYYTFSGWDKTDFIITEDTVISGAWSAHNYYTASYSWENAPSGVTLPETIVKLKSGDSIIVDTTYTSSSIVDTDTNYYTFSGWNKSGSIIITDNTTISGIWTAHNYYSVTYSWSNAPSGVTLPSNVTKLKPGDSVTVDTTYTSESIADGDSNYYTFSGWDKSGSIIITDNTTISGIWTAHNYYSVSYSWKNAPSGVTLPSNVTKLKPGDSVTVDTTYTSESIVDGDSKYYTFSGWNKSGSFNVTDNTIISGIWTAHNYYSVTYSWSNAPSRLQSTVPNTITKLKPGDNITVDTTYTNKTAKKDITNWTETIVNADDYWYSVCYGNGKFVAVARNSNYFAYSTDGINWTKGTISNTISTSNRGWTSVCYGNGKFVVVAYYGEYFAYSTNGINWTEGTISSTKKYWKSVCYSNDKFVAVGYDYDDDYFAYSIDGINWEEVIINPTSGTWYSVCYGNGKFVAVANGSNCFAYSTNGINWTEGTISDTKRDWYSVCYGNGKFVAVAYGSNCFAYSTNGINWTEGTISNTNRYWRSVCYGNDKFVAVASESNYFAYSTNGINWTECTISDTKRKWYSVCYGNDRFVTVAYISNYFAYSTNGMNWTESTISTDRYWQSVCYGNGKYVAVAKRGNYYAYSTDGINWTERIISNTSRYWRSVCYGNGKFVAVVYYSNYFAYSTDGITWTEGTISNTSRYWQSVCYGNGKFVAVASNRYFAYSTDGITWTEVTISNTDRYWQSVCYGNGKFVAVAENDNYFAYSTNGMNWTEGTISSTKRYWRSVCYGNGKYVAIAHNSNYFAYSTDGINWTEGTISSTSREWESVCYGNGKFVTVASGSNYFAYSTDRINWTEGTISSTSREWESVCYGNSKFVTVASGSNYFAYSTLDTIYYIFSGWDKSGNIVISNNLNITGSWSEYEYMTCSEIYSNTVSDKSWNKGCYGNNKYVIVGKLINRVWKSMCYGNGMYIAIDNESSSYIYSTDGINWTEGKISSNRNHLYSICYGNGKFVAITYGNSIYSTDGLHWTISSKFYNQEYSSICYGNGKFVAVADNNRFAYSTDGINWSGGTISSTSRKWQFVCYGNGKFIVISNNTNYFAYSTNGINWTEGTISSTSRQWQFVCYGNNKFVAVASSSNYFAYSTDGINWTEGTISSTSRQWTSVCYGNGKFVSVASGSNYFAYSTDGIHWTEGTISSTSRNAVSICYGNGKFISIGSYNISTYIDMTYIYYSDNGTTWKIGNVINGNGLYSTDGINWTECVIVNSTKSWEDICYGNGKYISINNNSFAYSTNGINWTEGSFSQTGYNSICYGNGKYVAIGYNNSYGYYAYSTNGINWSEGTFSDNDIQWIDVCYGNGKFVTVGYTWDSGVTGGYISYSTNGINWTIKKFTNNDVLWDEICYGNNKFVVAGGNYIAYSTDGINWIENSISDIGGFTQSLCYGDGIFIYTIASIKSGGNTFDQYYLFSTDGIQWNTKKKVYNGNCYDKLFYGNGKFIGLGYPLIGSLFTYVYNSPSTLNLVD